MSGAQGGPSVPAACPIQRGVGRHNRCPHPRLTAGIGSKIFRHGLDWVYSKHIVHGGSSAHGFRCPSGGYLATGVAGLGGPMAQHLGQHASRHKRDIKQLDGSEAAARRTSQGDSQRDEHALLQPTSRLAGLERGEVAVSSLKPVEPEHICSISPPHRDRSVTTCTARLLNPLSTIIYSHVTCTGSSSTYCGILEHPQIVPTWS